MMLAALLLALASAGDPPRVEAALVTRDLGLLVRAHDAAVQRRARLDVARLNDSLAEQRPFEAWRELGALVRLLAPSGKPIPAELSYARSGEEVAFVLRATVEPGLEARLAQAPPSWQLTRDGAILTIGGRPWSMRLAGTELVLAPDASFLDTPPLTLPDDLTAGLGDCDMVAYLPGEGRLFDMLTQQATEPSLREVVRSITAMGLGFAHDPDGSGVMRLVVAAPMIRQLGPLVRRPDLQDRVVARLGPEVMSYVSLALPPPLLGVVLRWIDEALAPFAPPSELRDAMLVMDGRLTLASFGVSGDWVVGMGFAGDVPPRLVPALGSWLGDAAARRGAGDVVVSEAQAVLLRADPALDGVRLTSQGDTLFVAGDKRRSGLLVGAAASGPLAGPLTPRVRAMLERPAMLSAYTVLGDDASWLGPLTWLGRGLEALLASASAESATLVRDVLADRWALSLAAGGAASLLAYDVAASADIAGDTVVLELVGSEL